MKTLLTNRMKKLLLQGIPCTLSLFLGNVSFGQKHPDEDIFPKKSYWQAGINYLSDNVYLGRKDSVKIPYISPSIGYYDKSGFYVNGSLSLLPSSGNSHIDMASLEAGYSIILNEF